MKLYARKILRVLPVYYGVLFFGWFIGPRLGSGPLWFNFKKLFYNCNRTWWAQLLFIGNFYPFYTEVDEGCMYWTWSITVDLQMYVLIPFYIWVYRKNQSLGIALQVIMFVVSTLVIVYLVWDFQMTAGLLSIENYYLFGLLLNKPYTKLGIYGLGVLLAYFY